MQQGAKDEMNELDQKRIDDAAAIIRDGGVVVAPTDTNMALCIDPWNDEAIDRVFRVKKRPFDSALTFFVADPGAIGELMDLSARESELLSSLIGAFLPGPLNVVGSRSAGVPDYPVRGGTSVSVGCVSNPVNRALIEAVGRPIAMTSANLSGQANGILVDEELAVRQIGHDVDMMLAGMGVSTTASSTIVALRDDHVVGLRWGDITTEQVRDVVGEAFVG